MSSVPAGGQETQRVSEFFHAGSGGDVIFCSSDNVLFHVQHKFLETNAEGFPLTDHTPPSNEIVKLTESSSVLELFFRFAYPQMPPDLDDLDFKSLMEFAEAAEKYLLHHARKFCIIEMKRFVSAHTTEIFAFAAEHDHEKLLYELAPRLVHRPLSEIVDKLPHSLCVPWSLHHDQRSQTITKYLQEAASNLYCTGNHLTIAQHNILWRQKIKELNLLETNGFLEWTEFVPPCYQSPCCSAWYDWRSRFQAELKGLKDFRQVVKEYREKKVGC